jgi:putative ubiquitin-RnfH superfamily antitoxin RatB of RatAB toxin-antitoxin module
MASELISISVVYALAHHQEIVRLKVEQATTVAEAVELSGLAREFPAIAAEGLQCAIYGRVVDLSQALRDGDRVEILRPLLIDPKEHRRQLAAKNKLKPK